MKTVHLLVLNYNGKELMEECLPSLVSSVQAAKHPSRLTVIDNCSTDGSVSYLKEHFPGVGLYESPQNRVLCSFNDVVRDVSEDIVILLNNDIRVREDFIDPLIDVFDRYGDAFMVSSRSFLFDGSFEGGKSQFFMKYGLFGSTCRFPGFEKFQESFGTTHQAGYGAFHRERFLKLGGYDDLYLPGRLEDADLCFRAWKRGFRCYYEPRSVLYHKGGASFHARFGISKTLVINFRNTFLFMWKNLGNPSIMFSHVVLLLPRLVFDLFRGRPQLAMGFLQAIPRLPQALRKRPWKQRSPMRTDFDVFNDPAFFQALEPDRKIEERTPKVSVV